MTSEQQLTTVLDRIATDHSGRSEIRDALAARAARRAAVHRRAAMGGSAIAAAAAIVAVFTIAGGAAGGSAPHQVRPAGSQSPTVVPTVGSSSPQETSAVAEARSRAEAAEQSALSKIKAAQSRVTAAAAATRRAVEQCQAAWLDHPVFAGDGIDPSVITDLAEACATAFGATSAPDITWVQTDMSAASGILGANSVGDHGKDPVVLVLVTGRFPITDDAGDSAALLIIPSDRTDQLGVDVSVDRQTVADITNLATSQHG